MKAAKSAPYAEAVGRVIGKKKRKKKHPGFKNVAADIAAKEGVTKDQAAAMLAASSRGASAAAKKKNPRLRRVKG